jgi:hypothetical protein
MMKLLETVSSGQVACPGAAFGGGGGGSAGVGCVCLRAGHDMGTLVRSNKNQRGDGTKNLPFFGGSVTTVDYQRFQLPKLQVRVAGCYVVTAVHVDRLEK